jgi:hypothetical protein
VGGAAGGQLAFVKCIYGFSTLAEIGHELAVLDGVSKYGWDSVDRPQTWTFPQRPGISNGLQY